MRHFISQLANKAQPFTKVLRKGIQYNWDKDCEQHLQQIKEYLSNPPILMPLIQGKPLILYISATYTSLGALLPQHDDNKKERAIYYISRTLVSYEMNYTIIEKAFLALVFASQKLRHYMLTHSIKLVAKIDLLKYLLSKATLIGDWLNGSWFLLNLILNMWNINPSKDRLLQTNLLMLHLKTINLYI